MARRINNELVPYGVLICGAILSCASIAQEPARPDTSDNVIEEIIVTAQRREENMQDIPIAITVFPAQELIEFRINRASQIAQYTPNVNLKTTIGSQNPVITIRGVGLNDESPNGNPAVGVYVDGVYLNSITMMSFQVFDTERVEVLKGPQGTLYGRNTTAGAINFVSRKPADTFDAFVKADAGNYATFNVEAALGGPIGETVNGRIALVSNQQMEGQSTNRLTGNDHGGIDFVAWRAMLDWQPTDNIGVLFNVHGGEDKSDVYLYEHFGTMDPGTGGPCQAFLEGRTDPETCTDIFGYSDRDGDPFTGDYNMEPETDNSAFGAAITLDWLLQAFTVTSISGYEQLSMDFTSEADASPLTYQQGGARFEVEQFSQEIRLTSAPHDTFEWVAGFFYSSAAIDAPNGEFQFDDLLATRVGVSFEQETDASALFARGAWQVSDRLQFFGGLRYTDEDRSYVGGTADLNPFGTSCFLDPVACNPGQTGPIFISFTDDSEKDNDLSGEIGVNYTPANDRLLYAKIGKGFKGGGWNGGPTLNSVALAPYRAETVLAYEVGFKSLLLDQSLQLNVAAFYYDYEDIQLLALDNPMAILETLTNATEADISGFDADIRWKPVAGLELNFGLGYLNTENRDPRFSGLVLANSPNWNGNATARYSWRWSNGMEPFAMLHVSYTDSVFTLADNDPLYRAPAYTLWDARAGITGSNGRWEASLWAQNLTDEAYFVNSFVGPFAFNGWRIYQMPRTYGASVTYRWQ